MSAARQLSGYDGRYPFAMTLARFRVSILQERATCPEIGRLRQIAMHFELRMLWYASHSAVTRVGMISTMDQSAFRKRLFVIAATGACALLALVWVFIRHDLSPRGFAVTVLIWWVAMFAVLYRFIRLQQLSAEDVRKKQIASGVSPEAIDRDRCIKNIRGVKRLIAVFAVLLGYGLLSTQGAPLLPRTIGASIDVFFLAVCIRSLMQSQKKLKSLPADRSNQSKGLN